MREKTKTRDGLADLRNPFPTPYQVATGAGAFFPCSGNGNGQSWNNRAGNGNFWSSSLNSATNGRNLNFNSGGVNTQNTNNRFNGFAVRPVQISCLDGCMPFLLLPWLICKDMMTLTKEQLLRDLYVAYWCARRGKSQMSYVVEWDANLKANMEALCDDLYRRRYRPLPSKCFIIDYPKKREIFAAQFRDRIVHHLYYNWTHRLFEATFIQDSYSCVPGRGTHYGIGRVADMLRRESHGWQRPCYALHLDIRGYFMHIVRQRLLEIATASLRKMASHRVPKQVLAAGSVCCRTTAAHPRWRDVLDIDFICWLTEVIVMLDPKENCIIVGSPEDWDDLDPAKSMLHLLDGLGLPIGNLTSQLFSNVYLNVLDQFCKRDLKIRNYGRYVDDSLLVSADKEWLLSLVPRLRDFLKRELGLDLHMGKLEVSEVHRGVEFLGVFVKLYRTYTSNKTIERICKSIRLLIHPSRRHAGPAMTHPLNSRRGRPLPAARMLRSVNSYLGILSHTASCRLRRELFFRKEFLRLGVFDAGMTKITERKHYFHKLLKQNDYEQNVRTSERLRLSARRRQPTRHRLRNETSIGRTL